MDHVLLSGQSWRNCLFFSDGNCIVYFPLSLNLSQCYQGLQRWGLPSLLFFARPPWSQQRPDHPSSIYAQVLKRDRDAPDLAWPPSFPEPPSTSSSHASPFLSRILLWREASRGWPLQKRPASIILSLPTVVQSSWHYQVMTWPHMGGNVLTFTVSSWHSSHTGTSSDSEWLHSMARRQFLKTQNCSVSQGMDVYLPSRLLWADGHSKHLTLGLLYS